MMPHSPFAQPPKEAISSGFSLVELLVALAIFGILTVAVFNLFTAVLTSSGEQASVSKRSGDTRLGLGLMRSDLKNAGFGIATNQPGSATKGASDAVAGTASSLTILSTAVHSHGAEAGLHGFVDSGGSVSDGMGGQIDGTIRGIRMTPDRDEGEVLDASSLTGQESGQLFFAGNQDGGDPYYFERTYELSNPCSGSDCGECADDTSNFQFDDANGAAGSIVDCVHDLRFRYGFEDNNGDIQFDTNADASGLTNLKDQTPDLLKVGLIYQAGDRRSSVTTPGPVGYNDSDFSSVSVSLNSDQQRYRWIIEEFSVSLENLP